MAKFMHINFENPKLTQSEIPNQLGYSSSTSKRYRNDKNTLQPIALNRITLINDQKRCEIQLSITIQVMNKTPKELIRTQMTSKRNDGIS